MNHTLLIEDKEFSDLNPVNFGYEDCCPGHTFGPARRHHYLIHYVTSGKGVFCAADGTKYHIHAGEAFLIRPLEVTVYAADKEDPWEYIWIGFNGRLAEAFADLPSPVLQLNGALFKEMKQAFTLPSLAEEFLTSKLFALYVDLFSPTGSSGHVARIKTYIDSNYMEEISICDLAHKLGLDRRYLARIFKQEEGISMQEYLIRRRLGEGAQLLRRGYTVLETALMVGYSDAPEFSRAFRKYYGTSPGSFRQKKPKQ